MSLARTANLLVLYRTNRRVTPNTLFGTSAKSSRRHFLCVLQDRAVNFADEREMLGETHAVIANCEVKPNHELVVQRRLAIHRLRQQMGDVPARRSHRLDPGDYPCDQPAVRLKGCHLMWPSRRCRQDVREGSSQVSQKFAAGPVSRAGSLNQSDLLST